MQKERKLEEIRSFRTSKRRKENKQRSDEKEKLKLSEVFYVCEEAQMRNQATKL